MSVIGATAGTAAGAAVGIPPPISTAIGTMMEEIISGMFKGKTPVIPGLQFKEIITPVIDSIMAAVGISDNYSYWIDIPDIGKMGGVWTAGIHLVNKRTNKDSSFFNVMFGTIERGITRFKFGAWPLSWKHWLQQRTTLPEISEFKSWLKDNIPDALAPEVAAPALPSPPITIAGFKFDTKIIIVFLILGVLAFLFLKK